MIVVDPHNILVFICDHVAVSIIGILIISVGSKNIAAKLDTTFDDFLSKTQEQNNFKDPSMLKRLKELNELSDSDKEHIL